MSDSPKRSFKLTPQRRALLESMRRQQGLDALAHDAPAEAAPIEDVAAVAGAATPPALAGAWVPPALATPSVASQQMAFGLMFFASVDQQTPAANKYTLLLDAARFADEHGFSCIWTPERHFHGFGGLFPNPAVVSAALATITRRLQLRAGSVISPLHNTLRIAEEWAVVDNLSDGRVAVSFGAGWNVDDFLFFPERFSQRHAVMFEQIEQIRQLWRGEAVTLVNSFGKAVDVRIYPQPIQPELPIWITSSSSTQNFVSAGAMGANVLTHLIGQDLPTLAGKIQLYREARARHNHAPQQGTITVMLHTYLGPDVEAVKATVRAPFRDYLRSAISLEEKAAIGGGTISGGHKIDPHHISEDMMEDLLDLTFERYFHEAALMGTPDGCSQFVQRLRAIGVDEIACLLDFGIEATAVMRSLEYLNTLRASWSGSAPTEIQ